MRASRIVFALTLAVGLSACAPESVESYHTGESEEQIVKLLNERNYSRAIWLIENQHGREPADAGTKLLLAQAYLGKAGFEPLAVAARVSGAQDFSTAAGQAFFPHCTRDRIESSRRVDPKCLLKRVYLQAPEPDETSFARARALLRLAYPSPAATPPHVNVLIGAVETASCVKRVGNVYLLVKRLRDRGRAPMPYEAVYARLQAERAIHEAANALERAQYAGGKISQLLTGNRVTPWFEAARDGARFVDRIGLARTLELLRDRVLTASDEVKYGQALDQISEFLADQERDDRD